MQSKVLTLTSLYFFGVILRESLTVLHIELFIKG